MNESLNVLSRCYARHFIFVTFFPRLKAGCTCGVLPHPNMCETSVGTPPKSSTAWGSEVPSGRKLTLRDCKAAATGLKGSRVSLTGGKKKVQSLFYYLELSGGNQQSLGKGKIWIGGACGDSIHIKTLPSIWNRLPVFGLLVNSAGA